MEQEFPTLMVVGALIEHEGQLLVSQRRYGDSFPGLWEFPGGKIKSGESPEEALQRECLEELGVTLKVGRIREVNIHRYDSFCVLLLFYNCKLIDGEPEAIECESFQWVNKGDLGDYEFLPGDKALVEELVQEAAVRPED